MLRICRNDYWPGLTPERLWEIPYAQWAALAIAADDIMAQHKQQADDLRAARARMNGGH